MLSTIGIAVIALAWAYEVYMLVGKSDKSVSPMFVGTYGLGVLLLVIDGFMVGATAGDWLNLVALLLTLWSLIVVTKKV